MPVLTVFCSESYLLYQYAQSYAPFLTYQFHCVKFYDVVFDSLGLELCSEWKAWLYLYSAQSHSVLSIPLLKMLLFSSMYFWILYQKSGVHRYVSLCLHLQFESPDQYVCFLREYRVVYNPIALYYNLKSGMLTPLVVLFIFLFLL